VAPEATAMHRQASSTGQPPVDAAVDLPAGLARA
jgi:hypothetical protein